MIAQSGERQTEDLKVARSIRAQGKIGRSIMVSIPASHAGDPGSIPGDRDTNFLMSQHDRVVKVVAC